MYFTVAAVAKVVPVVSVDTADPVVTAAMVVVQDTGFQLKPDVVVTVDPVAAVAAAVAVPVAPLLISSDLMSRQIQWKLQIPSSMTIPLQEVEPVEAAVSVVPWLPVVPARMVLAAADWIYVPAVPMIPAQAELLAIPITSVSPINRLRG